MKNSTTIALAAFTLVSTAGLATGQITGAYPSGLFHTPHGGAVLGAAAGRRLPVNNLGSSGQDGVDVQLHSALGAGAGVVSQPFLATPGASLTFTYRDWTGHVYGRQIVSSGTAASSTHTLDFSGSGATSINVVLYSETGTVLSNTTYNNPFVNIPGVPNFYCADGSIAVVWVRWVTLCNTCNPVLVYGWSCPNSGQDYSFQGRMVITPHFPVGTAPVTGLDSVAVTASGLPSITMGGAELGTFGAQSYGLGQGQISETCASSTGCTPAQRRLEVHNLGSSGQDGVAIGLPANTVAQTAMEGGGPALTRFLDATGHEISRLSETLDPASGGTVVTRDFTAMGATGVRVTCFDPNGGVITSLVTNTGYAGIVERGCPPGSYRTWVQPCIQCQGYWTPCTPISTMVLPNGTTVGGVARVGFTPLGSTHPAETRSMQITTTGPSNLIIDSLALAAPQCIADVDDGSGHGISDGGVTIDDLLYYLGIFTQGLASADVDDGSATGTPDGGVTIDDLLFYLSRFVAGC